MNGEIGPASKNVNYPDRSGYSVTKFDAFLRIATDGTFIDDQSVDKILISILSGELYGQQLSLFVQRLSSMNDNTPLVLRLKALAVRHACVFRVASEWTLGDAASQSQLGNLWREVQELFRKLHIDT